MAPTLTPVLERLCDSIEADELTGCWNWTARILPTGNGAFAIKEQNGEWRVRVVYEYFIGRIPDGLDLDHLCNHKTCVCPEHLEPVTNSENNRRRLARQTHCRSGHPLSGDNLYTYIRAGGVVTRHCRACRREADRRHDARQKEDRS